MLHSQSTEERDSHANAARATTGSGCGQNDRSELEGRLRIQRRTAGSAESLSEEKQWSSRCGASSVESSSDARESVAAPMRGQRSQAEWMAARLRGCRCEADQKIESIRVSVERSKAGERVRLGKSCAAVADLAAAELSRGGGGAVVIGVVSRV